MQDLVSWFSAKSTSQLFKAWSSALRFHILLILFLWNLDSKSSISDA